jgi:alpha-glucosidase
LYSKNQPENIRFLERFRALLDEYPATAAVGEVGDAQRGLELLGEYTSGETRMHMCYAFEFLAKNPLTAARVADVMHRLDAYAPDGWACWAFSNHDVMRHVSRWNLSPAAQRLFTTMMIALRGSLCLYQGEELGLPEADIAFEDLQDPYGIEFWPEFKGRDGCRTPMVWEPSNQNGGFSAAQPWLPITHDHLNRSVAQQETDPAAPLHHYRRALAFRRTHQPLVKGAHTQMTATGDVLHFVRTTDTQEIFCAFNLSATPSEMEMPAGKWHAIGAELGSTGPAQDGKLHLGPWQPCFALRTT